MKVFGVELDWNKPATSVTFAIAGLWWAAFFALVGVGPLCLASVLTSIILLFVANAMREKQE